ncbi:metallophosphoesterase [Olivibacter sitiensis]|uniref:metallophosphoesterase n=1 Tax=Olivibacter sitiensis TaxID=376470 RepID=UPI00040BF323|nr:metallophosphoesterase [Olivibacter sitiensis]
MKRNIKFIVAAIAFPFCVKECYAQKFTIPIFPDTQVEVGDRPEMYFSQIDWIINKKDSLNIPFVLHVGDLVNFDNFEHYEVASQGLDRLDTHRIPYAIALGNHDTEAVGEYSGSAAPGNVNQNLRKTNKFNAYFPPSRFLNQRGRYEAGKSDNAYYTFKVGKTNWLVINLEFCPRQGPINWAGDIVKQYHAYNVIIITHYYLTPQGEIANNNAGYGDFSPNDIFEKLVKKYENIKFVLSGHVVSSAYKIDKLENGNTVYQILQDYQHEDFGGGYLRLLTFDIDNSTVSAEMYSPYYDKTKQDSSKFSIDGVNFLKVRN